MVFLVVAMSVYKGYPIYLSSVKFLLFITKKTRPKQTTAHDSFKPTKRDKALPFYSIKGTVYAKQIYRYN